MMCGLVGQQMPCSARVVYKANMETDPALADLIVPLCGAHALKVEEQGIKVIPLVRRMWEGGVFA